MANDYTQNKTEIFSGINDQPQEATDQEGSNASDLIAKVNQTLDWLNEDFSNLENGGGSDSKETWDTFATLYFDTANGDDSNDGLSDSEPKQTLQAIVDVAKTKKVVYLIIEQLDDNAITIDSAINIDGIETKTSAQSDEYFYKRIEFSKCNFEFDMDSFDYFGGDEYRLFDASDYLDLTISFFECDIKSIRMQFLDNIVNYVFENCTLTADSNNGNALFIFVSIKESAPNQVKDFNIFFKDCLFDGESNSIEDFWFDEGNYNVTLLSCDWDGSWSSILNYGTTTWINGSPSRVNNFVTFPNFESNFDTDAIGSWGATQTEKNLISPDVFSRFSDFIDADKFVFDGINIIDGQAGGVKQVSESSVFGDAGGSDVSSGSDSVDLTDLNSKLNSIESKLNTVISSLKDVLIFRD